MKKLFKEPFLHFLLLGGVLFAVNAWRETKRPLQKDTARIDVTAGVIGRLRAGYERQFNRAPDEEGLRGLITAHIREEVLCREALAMGLDRDDTIVRRRRRRSPCCGVRWRRYPIRARSASTPSDSWKLRKKRPAPCRRGNACRS